MPRVAHKWHVWVSGHYPTDATHPFRGVADVAWQDVDLWQSTCKKLHGAMNVQKTASKRLVGVSEHGRPVGEDHPNAVLTNHEVDLMLRLRGEGWGWKRLTAKFQVSRSQVKRICRGENRAQFPSRYVEVDDGQGAGES